MQGPYVLPVVAYDPDMDNEIDEERGGFNAAFDVRRMHAAARAKAEAAGELAPGGHAEVATEDMCHPKPIEEILYGEEQASTQAQDREVRLCDMSSISMCDSLTCPRALI